MCDCGWERSRRGFRGFERDAGWRGQGRCHEDCNNQWWWTDRVSLHPRLCRGAGTSQSGEGARHDWERVRITEEGTISGITYFICRIYMKYTAYEVYTVP